MVAPQQQLMCLLVVLYQVRSEMAAKRALMVYRLNKAAFDYVIGEIHAKFMTSKVRRTELYGKNSFRVVLCCRIHSRVDKHQPKCEVG